MDEELCKKAVYSNEYYDLILDYIGGYSMGAPECIQQVDDTYDIGFYRRERAPELNLQDYPYLTIPHCLTPMDMTALEVSGMIRLQNPAALDLQGQGVLVGFVDTGINYEHPAFRNVDGSTRILGIWDQTQMGRSSAKWNGVWCFLWGRGDQCRAAGGTAAEHCTGAGRKWAWNFSGRDCLWKCGCRGRVFRSGAAGTHRSCKVQAGKTVSAGLLFYSRWRGMLSGK